MNTQNGTAGTGAARAMRVLVTWGTKLGGTEGIARIIGEVLQQEGYEVVVEPASRVRDVDCFAAVIVGGALYANRWHRAARRFVLRNVEALRRVPVWLFSSGPLDASADAQDIPAVTLVAVLMERIGACGHRTFGGRLATDAQGFPASAMAKTRSGDFRNPELIRAWAMSVAKALPSARPQGAIDHPGRSVGRLIMHGVSGWAVAAALMVGVLQVASLRAAGALHAVLAPLLFTLIAVHYFKARGAREPVPTALSWTAIVATLDAAVIGGAVLHDVASFASFAATWVSLGLVYASTWLTGFFVSTLPWPKGARDQTTHPAHG